MEQERKENVPFKGKNHTVTLKHTPSQIQVFFRSKCFKQIAELRTEGQFKHLGISPSLPVQENSIKTAPQRILHPVI